MDIYNVVVLASFGGGNFESLVLYSDKYGYNVTMLITDRECEALKKACKYGIECVVLHSKGNELFRNIEDIIPDNTDMIVLGGFMPLVPSWFCKRWNRKIINIHPSLLPKYGGRGMYGVKVQEAVMQNHERYAGCTVHYVDEGIDTGEIIEQWVIKIDYSLTPWELGGEIFNRGAILLPYVIGKLAMQKKSYYNSI